MSTASSTVPKGLVPYATIVGKLLQHQRESRGILQAQVAGALGLTQSAYSRLEKGESAMSVNQLRIASQVVGVSPNWVLSEAEKHALALKRRGVEVTDEKGDNTAALLIGLGVLVALLAAMR